MCLTLLLLFGISLILCLLLTPLARITALRLKLVDAPDNQRKIHTRPIPRVGGVPITISYFASCAVVAFIVPHPCIAVHTGLTSARAIAPAVLLIFLVGLMDDIFELKPWHKLLVQFIAAVMAVSVGVRIHDVGMFNLPPAVGMIATVVWLVACTNALNLIDGMDGLAAGVSLFAVAAALAASLITGSGAVAVVAAPLAGALIGFLVFNFNPASIFLGDSGSLVLGFLLGCYGVMWTGKSPALIELLAPLIALAIPLLDVAVAITRRFLRRQPIFKPDRAHIHHRLLALGLSHRRAVLCLYLAALSAGMLSLCLVVVQRRWASVVFGIFICVVTIGLHKLGYAEFRTALRMLIHSGFRRELVAQLALDDFQASFTEAESPEEVWAVLGEHCPGFGFRPVRMHLAGQMFGSVESKTSSSWGARIESVSNVWVELAREHGAARDTAAALSFADKLREILSIKNAALSE
jgi:UDP-GlcNAc:undecaprenyl-phosphate GlcNAc-1-phosphate transferase